MYINPAQSPEIEKIVAATFPTKRNVVVKEFRGPMNVNSYWDGGSRDEYKLYSLETTKVIPFPESHPYFSRKSDGNRAGILKVKQLPENYVLVRGGTFQGKPATVYLYFRPENLVKLIPQQTVELSEQAKSALEVIGGFTSSYRKEEFLRRNLGPYSKDNVLLVELAQKNLVKITGAGISITAEGRNARK